MFGLEALQLANELVVVGIGDRRRVVLVVGDVVPTDLGPEPFDALRRIGHQGESSVAL